MLLIAIKENALLHEIIYMVLVAGNFLNTVSAVNNVSSLTFHIRDFGVNIIVTVSLTI